MDDMQPLSPYSSSSSDSSLPPLPSPELTQQNHQYYTLLNGFCRSTPAEASTSRKRSVEEDNHNREGTVKRLCLESEGSETLPQPDEPLTVFSLPRELQEYILSFLSFNEIARIRLVCHQLKQSGEAVLNKAFARLQSQVQTRFTNIKSQMPRRESARRKHPLARESDIIETLHMRLTLLQMTFGKHIERGHCSFFAGEILDEVLRILSYVLTTPNLGRAYKVTDELFDLSTMAMEYFKENIEPRLPEINYFTTEFPDFTASFSSPGPRTFLFQVETPKSTSPVASTSRSMPQEETPGPAPQKGQVSSAASIVRTLRRNLRKCTMDVSTLKRELRACRSKIAYQQKQLLESNSKLEQHERRFDEQNRKLEALVKELQKCKAQAQCDKRKKVITRVRRRGEDNPRATDNNEMSNSGPRGQHVVSENTQPSCSYQTTGIKNNVPPKL